MLTLILMRPLRGSENVPDFAGVCMHVCVLWNKVFHMVVLQYKLNLRGILTMAV